MKFSKTIFRYNVSSHRYYCVRGIFLDPRDHLIKDMCSLSIESFAIVGRRAVLRQFPLLRAAII